MPVARWAGEQTFNNPVVTKVHQVYVDMEDHIDAFLRLHGQDMTIAAADQLQDEVQLMLERVVMLMEEYRAKPSNMDEAAEDFYEGYQALIGTGSGLTLKLMDIVGVKPGDADMLYYRSLQRLRQMTRALRNSTLVE